MTIRCNTLRSRTKGITHMAFFPSLPENAGVRHILMLNPAAFGLPEALNQSLLDAELSLGRP